MTTALTRSALERFAHNPEFHRRAMAAIAAGEKAEATREHVDSYTRPIFDSFGFGAEYWQRLYLLLDEHEARVHEYFAACDRAHREHGYDLPPDYCPALVAEHEHIAALRDLRELACGVLGIPEPIQMEHCERLETLLLDMYRDVMSHA